MHLKWQYVWVIGKRTSIEQEANNTCCWTKLIPKSPMVPSKLCVVWSLGLTKSMCIVCCAQVNWRPNLLRLQHSKDLIKEIKTDETSRIILWQLINICFKQTQKRSTRVRSEKFQSNQLPTSNSLLCLLSLMTCGWMNYRLTVS